MSAVFSCQTLGADSAPDGAQVSLPVESRTVHTGGAQVNATRDGQRIATCGDGDSWPLSTAVPSPSYERGCAGKGDAEGCLPPQACERGVEDGEQVHFHRHSRPVCCWQAGVCEGESPNAVALLRVESQRSTTTRAGPSSRLHLACYLLSRAETVATQRQLRFPLEPRKVFEFDVDVPGYGVLESGPFNRLCCNSTGTGIALSNVRSCYVAEPPRELSRITRSSAASSVRGGLLNLQCREPVNARPLLVAPLEAGGLAACGLGVGRRFIQEAFHPFSETSILVLSHEPVGVAVETASEVPAERRVRGVLRVFELRASTEQPEEELLVPLPLREEGVEGGSDEDLPVSFTFGASLRNVDLWSALSVGVSLGVSAGALCVYSPLLPSSASLPLALQLLLTDAIVANELHRKAHSATAASEAVLSETEAEREALLYFQQRSASARASDLQPQATLLSFPRGEKCAFSAACLWGASPLLTAIRCGSLQNGSCKVECLASAEALVPRLEVRIPLLDQQLRQRGHAVPRMQRFAKVKEAFLPTNSATASQCRLWPLPPETEQGCWGCVTTCLVGWGQGVSSVRMQWPAVLSTRNKRQAAEQTVFTTHPLTSLDRGQGRPAEDFQIQVLLPVSGGASHSALLVVASGDRERGSSSGVSTEPQPDVVEWVSLAPCGSRNTGPAASQEEVSSSLATQQGGMDLREDVEAAVGVAGRRLAAVREAHAESVRLLLAVRASKAEAVALALAASESAAPSSVVRQASAAASAFAIDCIKWIKSTDAGFLAVQKQELAKLRVAATRRLAALGAAVQELLADCACEAKRLQEGTQLLQRRLQNLREQSVSPVSVFRSRAGPRFARCMVLVVPVSALPGAVASPTEEGRRGVVSAATVLDFFKEMLRDLLSNILDSTRMECQLHG